MRHFLVSVALILMCGTAFAHSDATGAAGGFSSGFMHPILGLDHVLAMVAVGLWGAFLGRPAIWVLPIVFPLVMAMGGILGIYGVNIPYIEIGIAASAIILGLMVALAAKPPLWFAALIVATFAIFHGHAHGAELPHSASAMTYSIGFVIATGLLHLAGIAFGFLTSVPKGTLIVRIAGLLIACGGAWFLWKAI